jgi:hypothetical protein
MNGLEAVRLVFYNEDDIRAMPRAWADRLIRPRKYTDCEVPDIGATDMNSIRNLIEGIYSSEFYLGAEYVIRYGIYRIGCWEWDLRPYLRKYSVRYQNDEWLECYAPNKRRLREVLYRHLFRVTELPPETTKGTPPEIPQEPQPEEQTEEQTQEQTQEQTGIPPNETGDAQEGVPEADPEAGSGAKESSINFL